MPFLKYIVIFGGRLLTIWMYMYIISTSCIQFNNIFHLKYIIFFPFRLLFYTLTYMGSEDLGFTTLPLTLPQSLLIFIAAVN